MMRNLELPYVLFQQFNVEERAPAVLVPEGLDVVYRQGRGAYLFQARGAFKQAKIGKRVLSSFPMKLVYINWLVAGIGALLLMSSFSVYITLRDRTAIDRSFLASRAALDSLYAGRGRELAYVSPRDSASHTPDIRLRDLRIRTAENRIHFQETLQSTQNLVKIADYKKLLWSSLMGIAGLIGLAIIFAGRKKSQG